MLFGVPFGRAFVFWHFYQTVNMIPAAGDIGRPLIENNRIRRYDNVRRSLLSRRGERLARETRFKFKSKLGGR